MSYIGKKPVDFNDVTEAQTFTVTGDLTVDTDTLFVDSTNNRVGVGTVSPSYPFELSGTTNPILAVTDTTTPVTTILRALDSSGYVGTQTSHPLLVLTGGSERMRIDSSGNLLVNKTSSDFGVTTGLEFLAGSDDILYLTSDSQVPLILRRNTTDGRIVFFRKDGVTVGSINSRSGLVCSIVLDPRSSGAGLTGSTREVQPADENGNSLDNAVDMGAPAVRFDDIRATNGTIQTSDRNEKQQIASLTDAEITAAKAISKLFKTFKWNSSVTANGDNARTHSGVISQDVSSAMTDAGLDPTKYAFFCSDTWWETQTDVPAVEADEENGIEAQNAYTRTDIYETADEAPEGATERTRLGIRYPELLAFIGAATEQRLTHLETLEARIEALENA